MNRYFITGTDTDCGKTLVTTALLLQAAKQGLTTVGLKPVSAGCEVVSGQLQNQDALLIQSAMTQKLDYERVNPVAFLPAIAPHIAAIEARYPLSLTDLTLLLQPGLSHNVDLTLIEGAGGWMVPLNDTEYLSDLCAVLSLEVILVVGLKLGCLNHALLTQEKIIQSGGRIAGWVANQITPDMARLEENMQTLHQHLKGRFLGHIPYLSAETDLSRAEQALQFLLLPTSNEE